MEWIWRRRLMDNLDLAAPSEIGYAGDYFLWKAFSSRHPAVWQQSATGGSDARSVPT
jgi:hypothetical protein